MEVFLTRSFGLRRRMPEKLSRPSRIFPCAFYKVSNAFVVMSVFDLQTRACIGQGGLLQATGSPMAKAPFWGLPPSN
jgi:hypothetical protein